MPRNSIPYWKFTNHESVCHHVFPTRCHVFYSRTPGKTLPVYFYIALSLSLSLIPRHHVFIVTGDIATKGNNGRQTHNGSWLTSRLGSQRVLSFAYSPAKTMAARNSSTSEDLILVESASGSRSVPRSEEIYRLFRLAFPSHSLSLSFFLSLPPSLSLSLWPILDGPLISGTTLQGLRHTEDRSEISRVFHFFFRIREGGGGLSFSLSLSVRVYMSPRWIEDEFRFKDAEFEGVGYRSRTDRGPPLVAPYISTTTIGVPHVRRTPLSIPTIVCRSSSPRLPPRMQWRSSPISFGNDSLCFFSFSRSKLKRSRGYSLSRGGIGVDD